MPPRKSKRIAQKKTQAGPTAPGSTDILTPAQITTTLAQLLEGQRHIQQQIDALMAQQNQQAGLQPANTDRGQELAQTRHQAPAHPSKTEEARTIINKGALSEKQHRSARFGNRLENVRLRAITISGIRSTRTVAVPRFTGQHTMRRKPIPLTQPMLEVVGRLWRLG